MQPSSNFLIYLFLAAFFVGSACTTSPTETPNSPPANVEQKPDNTFPLPPSLRSDVFGEEIAPIQSDKTREPAIRKALQKQGAYAPRNSLRLCGGNVSNAPEVDSEGRVKDYFPYINVEGVRLALAPVNDTCLSSSFGPRWGRQHKGIDLASRRNEPAYAAGAGRIIKADYSPSFGNLVLIKHSDKVYTRYAHLDVIDEKIAVGRTIGPGQPIGLIGKTGLARGIHLHYEVLTTNDAGRKVQVNPFDFKAYVDEDLPLS